MLDSLTLDHLRTFVAVAETGSFSAAARRLRRAQSSISQSVQALESTLALALFDRTGKTPVLTEAGAALLEQTRRTLDEVAALRARAQSLANEVEAELTLAVDQVFPSAILMESLAALREAFPQVPVTLFTEGLGATEQRLREGVARLAIYSPVLGQINGLEVEFLTSIEILPVVSADHPLAAQAELISQTEIAAHIQLVLADRAQALSGIVMSPNTWRFADQHTRLEYLLRGFGWSYMPAHFARDLIAGGRIKRLALRAFAGRNLSLPLYLVHQRGHRLGAAAAWLVADLRRRLALLRGLAGDPGGTLDPIPIHFDASADLPAAARIGKP